MKLTLIILVTAGLGIAAGLTTTWLEFRNAREQFRPVNEVEPRFAPLTTAAGTSPKLQIEVEPGVEGNVFDFGTMERYATRRHTFLFRNVGSAPLSIDMGRITCKCTIGNLSDNFIEPGDTATITLEWNAHSAEGSGTNFQQVAEFHTNDPDLMLARLIIQGTVTDRLKTEPVSLAVGEISANDQLSFSFRVYGYQDSDLAIENVEFVNESTADRFDYRVTALSDEQLSEDQNVLAGYRIEVLVEPGLPHGPIDQTIRVTTNLGDDIHLEVPMLGTVASDIMVLGPPEYDRRKNILDLGIVRQGLGARAELQLYVKGPYRADVELSAGEVDPDGAITVTLGPREEVNQGSVYKYALTIEIPPGTPLVNRLGSAAAPLAKVTIDSTHPQSREVPIYVKFAVEP